MFKKLLLAIATLVATMGFALAQVDVNKADQAALDGVKGVGPKTSTAILDERKKGEFKDWADLESRVKGIGDKSAQRLSDAGLTVNGQPRPKTTAAAKDTKKTKSSADAGKDTTKTGAGQESKPAASGGTSDAKAADAKGAKKDAKKEEKKEEAKK